MEAMKRETRDQANFMNHSGIMTALMKMMSEAAVRETGAKGALQVRAMMSWQLNSKISFNKEIKMKKVKKEFMRVLLLRERDDPTLSTAESFLYPSKQRDNNSNGYFYAKKSTSVPKLLKIVTKVVKVTINAYQRAERVECFHGNKTKRVPSAWLQ